ncbi:MAG: hypothetical protein AABZ47_13810 [Planctomycetota bacterium]
MNGKSFSSRCGRTLLLGFLGILGCNPDPGGSGDSCPAGSGNAATTVSYTNDIVPLFTTAGCLSSACHGGTFPASQYNLSTYESSFARGDDATRLTVCNIVPGDPARSFLIEKLRDDNPRVGDRMPLEREPLTEEEIVLIETWIQEGARSN